ncbi:hypothetical protein Gotur_026826, partial [Gossypium turneri]
CYTSYFDRFLKFESWSFNPNKGDYREKQSHSSKVRSLVSFH